MPCTDNMNDKPRSGRSGLFVRLLFAVSTLGGLVDLRSARADNIVTDWNNEFLLITQQTSGNLVAGPPEVAREIAVIGEAMSDAVNAASGSVLSSFAYTGGPVTNANINVAAAAAAYTALTGLFNDAAWQTPISTVTGTGTNMSNVTLANNIVLPELKSFLSSELSSQGLANAGTTCAASTSVLCNGYNLGIAAGNAVNAASSTNSVTSGAVAAIQNGLTSQAPAGSGTVPGVYVPPSATGGRPEMFPTWGTTTPTGLTSAQMASAQATVSGPPGIGSTAYAAALLQTECQGSAVGLGNLPANVQSACSVAGYTQQTTAQAKAALFWNDPGTTIQPPGHWLQIADTAMVSQSSSLLQSAQLTALLGEAMNDAGIAAWGDKYANNLWRPITAIRDCDTTGTGTVTWNSNLMSCDPTWSSLIATPPHPDYVAGHPAFSGAAATILADYFGKDAISFSSSSNYYCNGGTAAFDPSINLLVSCTLNGTTYLVSNSADCATIINGVNSNTSPLICPITETFASFSGAAAGPDGSEFSRIAGGIHTPFAVQDALTIGDSIGQQLAVNAGLTDVLPEPPAWPISVAAMFALTRLRRR